MRNHSDMTLILQGEMPTGRSTETVSSGTETGNTFSFEGRDYSIDSWDPRFRPMLGNPSIAIESG